jgi:hypothetical protein
VLRSGRLLMEAVRTDFTGYEGQYVAIDARTGRIVLANEDLLALLEEVKGHDHVSVRGRVPYADEPLYHFGLG